MGYNSTVFNQLFNFIPRYVFEKSAKHHKKKGVKKGVSACIDA